jgi:hypothetical protein
MAAKLLGVGPARRCLVPSLQWVVVSFQGMRSPQAWIFDGVLTAWVPSTESPWVRLPGAQACAERGYKVGP